MHPNSLHPFGFICRFPPVGLSTTSCVYVVSISKFLLHPCASQQLPACIWFQYLGFLCLSTTSCAHLVSISNFPAMCLSSNFLNFLHLLGLDIYAESMLSRECSAPLLVTHWVNFYSSLLFRPFSCAGAQLGVSLCESAPLGGIHLASISKLPTLVPLSNFLHSFTWCQDFPSGLLTTFCAHLVSISNFLPVPLIKLLKLPAFIGFQYLYSPGSAAPLLVTHWVSHLLPSPPSSSQCLLFTPLCPTWGHSSGFNIYLRKILHYPAFIHLVSILPLSSLNNFYYASQFGFNVYTSPVSQQLLALIWFQYLTSPLCVSSNF